MLLAGDLRRLAREQRRGSAGHNLDVLLHLSGRETIIRTELLSEWSVVVKWDPDVRYRPAGHATQATLEDMIEAARKIVRGLR